MNIFKARPLRRVGNAVMVALSAAALGACGSSSADDDSKSTTGSSGGSASAGPSNQQDSARVRLIQCLRDQGIDVPDNIGEGGEVPEDLDTDAIRAALDGPCARYRAGAFGDTARSGESAAQEKLDKYAQCMRNAGFDFPDVELGNGPPLALHEIDTSDPEFQKADQKCAALRVTPADVMGGG